MNVITTINNTIETATGITPVAFSSSSIESLPCISFIAYRQGDTGTIESWRYQTRITADCLEDAMDIEEEIAEALVSIGDLGSNGALSIQVNGGGSLEDERTGLPQLITYYDINTKSYERGTI